ncbi:MAG: dihydrolipoamide acetyltransferase family protein [Solirubrobacterales bacterium]
MADIVMPRLSDTMEEGTILRWLLSDGESVSRGQELVEIETDKATMVYESDQDGTLQTVAAEGQTLAVGELIARVGADAQARTPDAGGPPPADDATPKDGRNSRATGDGALPAAAAADAPPAAPPAESPAGALAATPPPAGTRVKASPVARRVARESGVDLHTLRGTGPGGRIVKADVQVAAGASTVAAGASTVAAGASTVTAPPPPFSPEAVATAKGETTIVELSRTQQTIARRMAESKATIPDFTLHLDVDMHECVKLRKELKRLSQPEAQAQSASADVVAAPTYNDMVVKACALALREHPRVNGSYRDGHLQLYSRVNVGVAVAAAGALVVPTVFDAEEKSLGEIARETRALAERVRAGAITPPELGGGTFTVSNLGMYGIRSFAAIINPPQAAILSVGSVQPRAVAHEDQVISRPVMTLTLACDHRILYGADAALFLARIRELLEAPAALTL